MVRPTLRISAVQAIVLDIEGTTTPLAFVHEVLFPYVRIHLRAYLQDPKNREALREPFAQLRQEAADASGAPDPPPAPCTDRIPGELRRSAEAEGRRNTDAQTGSGPCTDGPSTFEDRADERLEWMAERVGWLMDRDRKSPGLKLLQGQIWEQGYRSGELVGDVFADVAPALGRWGDAGIAVAIYSSGSELAQRLLFGSTGHGDLTQLIAGFFDTAVGAKNSANSYRRIARELGCTTDRLLFISDVTAELDAAEAAGCQTLLCVRPDNRPQPQHAHATIHSFDDFDVTR